MPAERKNPDKPDLEEYRDVFRGQTPWESSQSAADVFARRDNEARDRHLSFERENLVAIAREHEKSSA